MRVGTDGHLRTTTRRDRLPLAAAMLLMLALLVLVYGFFAIRGVLVGSFGLALDVRQAHELVRECIQLQIDEESAIRGYSGTGNAKFLQPYYVAEKRLHEVRSQLGGALARLGITTALPSMKAAQALSARWTKETAMPLIEDPHSGQRLKLMLAGKDLLDRYRAEVGATEAILDSIEASSLRDASAGITRMLLYGSASILILGGLGIFLVARQVSTLSHLEHERESRRAAERVGDIRGVADALQQIVWAATPRGEIEYFNRRWREYTGKSTGEVHLDWADVVHRDDLEGFLRTWQSATSNGRGGTGECRLRRWDGHFRWHRFFIQPVTGREGAVVAWFATAEDIDDEKKALEGLRHDYEQEKLVADTLQEAFSSKSLAQTPEVAFQGSYVPAARDAKVGGDWFDAFELPDGRLLFSIGDVAGHGLDAAVTMNRVRQAILAAAVHDDDPGSVLTNVNTVALLQESGMVTALCGYIDVGTFTVRYASAGHPPPILHGPEGSARVLPLGGLPLGILHDASYATHTLVAEPRSMMVVYTDGVVEWKQDPVEGEQELLRAVTYVASTAHENDARAIHNAVFKGALPLDDVAIMVARFGTPSASGRIEEAARKRRPILPFRLRPMA
ncbi:MAG TPA: SpoIIE family protein phosphatase [Candidatus Dormibacteraeota bacterium]|nr:SpoIIE family protein phosphatase [Candidatus Dormibacteraeota bacterium]